MCRTRSPRANRQSSRNLGARDAPKMSVDPVKIEVDVKIWTMLVSRSLNEVNFMLHTPLQDSCDWRRGIARRVECRSRNPRSKKAKFER